MAPRNPSGKTYDARWKRTLREANAAAEAEKKANFKARLFVANFAGGYSYADIARERHGDYVRLAFMPHGTLALEFEKDCPSGFRELIEAHAKDIRARAAIAQALGADG